MEFSPYYWGRKSTPIKTAHTLALAAAGYIAYEWLRKAEGIGNLNFYPASIRKVRFEGSTPVMVLGIAVQNTSNQAFHIGGMAFNLYAVYNNKQYLIGNFSSFDPQQILPRSESIIEVNVRLNPLGVVNTVINAIQTGSYSVDLVLDGTINIENNQFAYSFNYKAGL